MSYKQATEVLEVDYSAVANWAEKFRAWLLLLDPTGAWEARVRLGIKPRPLIACPACGDDQSIRFPGFYDESGARRLACRTCNAIFKSPDAMQGTHFVESAIAYDPIGTRRRGGN